MKIKNLSKTLDGVKFKHPETGKTCIWVSQWNKGVWYKKDESDKRIYPLFVETLDDVLEFEIVEDEA